MDILDYQLENARNAVKDCGTERQYLETKLHNFIYIWLAVVLSICTLVGKTINTYDQYISMWSYQVFLAFEFLAITAITWLYLRVYEYRGRYTTVEKLREYLSTDRNDMEMDDLKKMDCRTYEKCAHNNRLLNTKRNTDFNMAKRAFKYYLGLQALLVLIIYMVN